jgi:hypothetical protein
MTMATSEYESADDEPAQVHHGQSQSTGDQRVDAALDRIAGLGELPLAAQVTVFDDVHRLLQDALTGNDAGSEDPGR